MIGPTSSRAPTSAACDRRLALADVPLDVLDHDDRVVDHEPDREHDREQREQVQREAEDLHQEDGADERHRDRDERHEHRAERAEEEEDDDDDDEDRLDRACCTTSWMALLMYFVESNATSRSMPVGSSLLDDLDLLADARDDVERVGVGQDPDAHEDGLLARRSGRPGRTCRRRARRRRRPRRRTSAPFCWRMTSFLNSSTDLQVGRSPSG